MLGMYTFKLSEILFDDIDFLYISLLYKHLCENFLEHLCSFLSAFTGTHKQI